MKKSVLSFGGILMLFLFVFSCTEESENVKLPDDGVNFKGQVDNEKQQSNEKVHITLPT